MNWLFASKAVPRPLEEYEQMTEENSYLPSPGPMKAKKAIPPSTRGLLKSKKKVPLKASNHENNGSRTREETVCFRLAQQYPEEVEAYMRQEELRRGAPLASATAARRRILFDDDDDDDRVVPIDVHQDLLRQNEILQQELETMRRACERAEKRLSASTRSSLVGTENNKECSGLRRCRRSSFGESDEFSESGDFERVAKEKKKIREAEEENFGSSSSSRDQEALISLDSAKAALVRSVKLRDQTTDPKEIYRLDKEVDKWSSIVTRHPDQRARAKVAQEEWMKQETERALPCLERVKSFVPLAGGENMAPEQLTREYLGNYSCDDGDGDGGEEDFAFFSSVSERILRRARALQFVRKSPSAIARIHAADLHSTYSTHGLGLTEARAVWQASKNAPFADDRKKDWLAQLEHKLKTHQDSGSLFDDPDLYGPFLDEEEDELLGQPTTNLSAFESKEEIVSRKNIKQVSPPQGHIIPEEEEEKKTPSTMILGCLDDEEEEEEEDLDRPASLTSPLQSEASPQLRSTSRFPKERRFTMQDFIAPTENKNDRSPSLPPSPRGRMSTSAVTPRSASVPPRRKRLELDEWWRRAVQNGQGTTALDRVKRANAAMKSARLSSNEPRPQQPLDLTHFLKTNDLLEFEAPLAALLYLTTDDLKAMQDYEIEHITQTSTFSETDLLRFKRALKVLKRKSSSSS